MVMRAVTMTKTWMDGMTIQTANRSFLEEKQTQMWYLLGKTIQRLYKAVTI